MGYSKQLWSNCHWWIPRPCVLATIWPRQNGYAHTWFSLWGRKRAKEMLHIFWWRYILQVLYAVVSGIQILMVYLGMTRSWRRTQESIRNQTVNLDLGLCGVCENGRAEISGWFLVALCDQTTAGLDAPKGAHFSPFDHMSSRWIFHWQPLFSRQATRLHGVPEPKLIVSQRKALTAALWNGLLWHPKLSCWHGDRGVCVPHPRNC